MHGQKRGMVLSLLCLLLFVFPLVGYAQPTVTFYSAYLYQTEASSSFDNEIHLRLFLADGSEIRASADLDVLRINGIRYDDAQEACRVLESAGVIQYALDGELQIVRVDFTPLQVRLTEQIYDETTGRFANTAIDADLPVFYLADNRLDQPVFAAPYLSAGYTYDVAVYGDGIVITDMRAQDDVPYIRALTTAVEDGFEQKTIEVTAFLSDIAQPFTVTAVSPLGFSASQTAGSGEDTVSIVYDGNREDVVTITASIAGGPSWETTVALHTADVHSAVINRMEESGSAFDEAVAIELFFPDGDRGVVIAEDITRINGRRYETAAEMMEVLESALVIQFVETESGYLDTVRFDTERPVVQNGVSCAEIPQELPLFYRYSDGMSQLFAPPYLADGYTYDIACSAYGAIITNMSYSGKQAVIHRVFTDVNMAFETQSIMVNPVFSAGDLPFTAVLSDETGTIAALQSLGEAVVFEDLPNQTHDYTITLSSEQSDTRQIAVQTVRADVYTGYLNRYATGSAWEKIAVLEVLDAAGTRQLQLTEDSVVNGQSSNKWDDILDELLQGVKIVQYIKADDGSIASLRFAQDQSSQQFMDVRYDDTVQWFDGLVSLPKKPLLYIRDDGDSNQPISAPPYLNSGYLYRLEHFQDAIVIRDMTYMGSNSTIEVFDAVVMPGLYEQSVECWAKFSTDIEAAPFAVPAAQYTVQLWREGKLLEEQMAARGDTVIFEHLPAEAHTYTVRFFAEDSDTREMTVETAQINIRSAVVGTIAKAEAEEPGTGQMVASVMENGRLHTYAFHPDATLPDGSPVIEKQASRAAAPVLEEGTGARQRVLFSLNQNQEITHMRYAEPVVITHTEQVEGQLKISYVLTMFNADTIQQQSVTPCAAVYRGNEMVGVRIYDTMPVGEDGVVADTIVLDDVVQPEVPLTVKAIWLTDLTSLHPLSLLDME